MSGDDTELVFHDMSHSRSIERQGIHIGQLYSEQDQVFLFPCRLSLGQGFSAAELLAIVAEMKATKE